MATDMMRFVSEVRQRLAALERNVRNGNRPARSAAHAGAMQVYKVVKPIKPGEAGSGVQMWYSTKQVPEGDPPEDQHDEGWIQVGANNDSALVITDSEYQTLAMPGALIRATFFMNRLRTTGEYGITNVRVKAIADVAADVEGEYQIIDGGPQVYDGSPVTIPATLDHDVATNDTFLFSYDRVDRIWYEVKTSGSGTRWIRARAKDDVLNTTAEFTAIWVSDLIGTGGPITAGTNDITVKNWDVGTMYESDGTTVIFNDETEYVFALKKGMLFAAFLCDDGKWQAIQSGGVLEDYDYYTASGGPGGEIV